MPAQTHAGAPSPRAPAPNPPLPAKGRAPQHPPACQPAGATTRGPRGLQEELPLWRDTAADCFDW